MIERRRRFLLSDLFINSKVAKLAYAFGGKWLLPLERERAMIPKARLLQSTMQTPCSAYRKTKELIYFARMLDKIRLNAQGRLTPGYFLGVADPTFFDARCTRFLGVNYDKLAARTLEGGSDEEILDWCFAQGRKPGDEEILV